MGKLPEGVRVIGENRYHCGCCGYRWRSLRKDLSCPKCTYLQSLERCNLSSDSPFRTRRSRVTVKCLKCGYSWDTRADAIMEGRVCYYCKFGRELPKRNHSKGFKTKITTEEYASQISPQAIAPVSEYRGSGSPIRLRCLREGCGHLWGITPKRLPLTPGCPKCSKGKVNLYRPCTLYFLRIRGPGGQDLYRVEASSLSLNYTIPVVDRDIILEVYEVEIGTGRESLEILDQLCKSFADRKYRGQVFFMRSNDRTFTEDIYLHYRSSMWALY